MTVNIDLNLPYLTPEDVNRFLENFPAMQTSPADFTADESTPPSDSSSSTEKLAEAGAGSDKKTKKTAQHQFKKAKFPDFCIGLGISTNCLVEYITNFLKTNGQAEEGLPVFRVSLKNCLNMLIDRCTQYIETYSPYYYQVTHFRVLIKSIVHMVDEGFCLLFIQSNLDNLHKEIALSKEQGMSPDGNQSKDLKIQDTKTVILPPIRRAEVSPNSYDIKISAIAKGCFSAVSKQKYFHNFLIYVQSRIREIVDDCALRASLIQLLNDIMENTAGKSSMLDMHIQEVLSDLITNCDNYLQPSLVPFFMEVTQFKAKLLSLQQKISEHSVATLDDELKSLHECALNHLGAPWLETVRCGPPTLTQVIRSNDDSKIFLKMLKIHFERLKNFYDFLVQTNPGATSPILERRAPTAILLTNAFFQLIIECDEYLETHAESPFLQFVQLFKEILDNTWLQVNNTGDMREDLKSLQSILEAQNQDA
jgi:hypothetical protein